MSGRTHILVLEDSPVQCRLYEKILGAGGYDVTTIEEPAKLVEGLDDVRFPDAILLDIVLPGMDGVTVLEILEKDRRWCTVPVILMTSSPTKDRVLAAQRLPVPPEGFLVKPIDPDGMLALVGNVLGAKDPVFLMRARQRRRLSLSLGVMSDLEKLEKALKESYDSTGDLQKRIAWARRERQSLLTVDTSAVGREVGLAVRRKVEELDAATAHWRAELDATEVSRRDILRQRMDIMTKQKEIRDLERQIQDLTVLVRRNGSAGGAGGVREALAQAASAAVGGAGSARPATPGARPSPPKSAGPRPYGSMQTIYFTPAGASAGRAEARSGAAAELTPSARPEGDLSEQEEPGQPTASVPVPSAAAGSAPVASTAAGSAPVASTAAGSAPEASASAASASAGPAPAVSTPAAAATSASASSATPTRESPSSRWDRGPADPPIGSAPPPPSSKPPDLASPETRADADAADQARSQDLIARFRAYETGGAPGVRPGAGDDEKEKGSRNAAA